MNLSSQPARILLFALLLAGSLFAGFELRSYAVGISVNNDGTAHVEERALIFINTTQSRTLYEANDRNDDISSWRELLGIDEIRYHVSRANTEIANFRFRSEPPERCNQMMGTCFASIVFDYDALPLRANNTASGGIISTNTYKPRTTLYSLNPASLSFETTKTGDILLQKPVSLSITIPQDSQKIFFSREPDALRESQGDFARWGKDNVKYYAGKQRTYAWEGQTLSKFQLSFEREESLEREVLQFFKSIQERMTSLLFSSEGPAIVIILAIIAFSVVYLNHMRKRIA